MSATYAIGDRVWRWTRGHVYERRPAVVVGVGARSISTKSRADSDERPLVHRITRAGASGIGTMTAIEAARAADLETWSAMPMVHALHDSKLAVYAVRIYSADLRPEQVPTLRASLEAAEILLDREATRKEGRR